MLTEADRVEVTVEVRMPDGSPARGAHVSSAGQSLAVDERGRVQVLAFPGVPATFFGHHTPTDDPEAMLAAIREGRMLTSYRGIVEQQVAAGDLVQLGLEESSGRLSGMMDEAALETEDFVEEHTAFIDEALSRPGLSPEAIEQLQGWKERAFERQDGLYDVIDSLHEAEESYRAVGQPEDR